jgi:hypothetical protein
VRGPLCEGECGMYWGADILFGDGCVEVGDAVVDFEEVIQGEGEGSCHGSAEMLAGEACWRKGGRTIAVCHSTSIPGRARRPTSCRKYNEQ